MTHPCNGHACDHCYLCDVVGICCATVPPAVAAALRTAPQTAPAPQQPISPSSTPTLLTLLSEGRDDRLLPAPSPLSRALGDSLRAQLGAGDPSRLNLEVAHVLAPRRQPD